MNREVRPHLAYEIIAKGARNPANIPPLRQAFDIAWAKLQPHAADSASITLGLARTILTIGNKRSIIDPGEIAGIAVRTFRHSPHE